MRALRAALSGLTTRGRSFLAAGVAACVCALLLGQRDLLRVGLLLALLPVAGGVYVGRTRLQVTQNRQLRPSRIPVGESARVEVHLLNPAARATPTMLAEESLPYALGAAPRFVVGQLAAEGRAAVSYSVRPSFRGRYEVGPLRLTVTDPFGLCEATRTVPGTRTLLVTPAVVPLGGRPDLGRWGGTATTPSRRTALSGEPDHITRPYTSGDDMRRVHWRSSARRGELMVRRDEEARVAQATVLLDRRRRVLGDDTPDSALERAVSAAASVAAALLDDERHLCLLLDDAPPVWLPPGEESRTTVLEQLAAVEPSEDREFAPVAALARRVRNEGPVFAVLGELSLELARRLAGDGGSGERGVVLLVSAQTPDPRAVQVLRTAGWVWAPVGTAESGVAAATAIARAWAGVVDRTAAVAATGAAR